MMPMALARILVPQWICFQHPVLMDAVTLLSAILVLLVALLCSLKD